MRRPMPYKLHTMVLDIRDGENGKKTAPFRRGDGAGEHVAEDT